jgi:protein arginine N-methyltransferase 5
VQWFRPINSSSSPISCLICVHSLHSYTAYIAPVSSARLHSEAKIQSCHPLNNSEGPASPAVGMQRAMETPYVVRSHAASQTHPEAECWKFYHPQFAAARYCGNDPGDKHNASALAAENVNNDRHAHISFKNDPSNGCCFGCGYGALDTEVQPYVSANPEGILQSSSEDVTLTIHGFLGTFHSVLYRSYHDGGEVKKESVISVAPHSFSVGMFSWFPLVRPFTRWHPSHCYTHLWLTFCCCLIRPSCSTFHLRSHFEFHQEQH